MNRDSFIAYYPPLSAISDYLNHILFDHEEYIENSYVYICGVRANKLIIDTIDINPDLSDTEQLAMLTLMSNLATQNTQVIEESFKKIIANKLIPEPKIEKAKNINL